jgi:hypothetical protein
VPSRLRGARVVSASGEGNGDSPAEAFIRTVIDGAAQYEHGLIRARTPGNVCADRLARADDGMLSAASAQPGHRYGAQDVALARELGERVALAVDNARLYRKAQRAIELREEFPSVVPHELYTPVALCCCRRRRCWSRPGGSARRPRSRWRSSSSAKRRPGERHPIRALLMTITPARTRLDSLRAARERQRVKLSRNAGS